MVAVNESMKRALRPAGDYDMQTFILAGSGAGAVAAVVTNPLDVVKTRLQTQALKASASSDAGVFSAPAGAVAGEGAGGRGIGGMLNKVLRAGVHGGPGGAAANSQGLGMVLGGIKGTTIHSSAARCPTGRCGAEQPVVTLQYQGLLDAVCLFLEPRNKKRNSPLSLDVQTY